MKESMPIPSTMFIFLHFLSACVTVTAILVLSFNDRVMTNAFLSSTDNLRHWSLDQPLMSLPSTLSDGGLSELELLQQSLYQKEFVNLRHKSTWLDSMKQLPFDCTGCGNCCKTTGNVYMSPEEVLSAASYKNITASKFVDSYAGYKLETTSASKTIEAGDRKVPWILLQNRKAKNSEEGHAACVFLDHETNQCGIYSVRPIQCSTYPFWSNILESEQNWNDEVRRKDISDSDNEDNHSDLSVWTPDGGGCEGMKIVDGIEVETAATESEGIPVDRALEQLSLYERTDRRLPRSYNKIRL